MARRHYRRLDDCIYGDDAGIYAVVQVKGRPTERKRYPLDTWQTPEGRERVRAWVRATRGMMLDERKAFGPSAATVQRGTLAAAVVEWQSRLNVRKGAASDKSHARAWLALVLPGEDRPLGEWQRDEIATKHVDQAIQQWQTKPSPGAVRKVHVREHTRRDGKQTLPASVRSIPATSGEIASPRTIRHRCRVLQDVFRTLDATPERPRPPTPVDYAKVPKTPAGTVPQTISDAVLQPMLDRLPGINRASYLRFCVLLATMQRPVQLMLAQPDDLDLDGHAWTVRDAKGAPAHTIDLSDDAVDALRAFSNAALWGEFDTSRYGKHCHLAGLPRGIRPYNIRHTGARLALTAGVSMEKLSPQMGHTTTQTTKRFYTGFVRDASREVAAKLDGRFGGRFKEGPRLVKGQA